MSSSAMVKATARSSSDGLGILFVGANRFLTKTVKADLLRISPPSASAAFLKTANRADDERRGDASLGGLDSTGDDMVVTRLYLYRFAIVTQHPLQISTFKIRLFVFPSASSYYFSSFIGWLEVGSELKHVIEETTETKHDFYACFVSRNKLEIFIGVSCFGKRNTGIQWAVSRSVSADLCPVSFP